MKVALFIPCYVNTIYPEVGVASYKLLSYLGVEVEYPLKQTCCGQPLANAGFERRALPLCDHFEKLFGGYDYIVAPSASCVAFVKNHYPSLLESEGKGSSCSEKVYEICEFLYDVLKIDRLPTKFPHKVSIHNSCHGVRELRLSAASELNIPHFSKAKSLLQLVEGIELLEPKQSDECCGFGGMFAIEEGATSSCMGHDKLLSHIETGTEYITGTDSSCLMHLQGIKMRENLPVKLIHVAEILAKGL